MLADPIDMMIPRSAATALEVTADSTNCASADSLDSKSPVVCVSKYAASCVISDA
jgi:hypothetical protein